MLAIMTGLNNSMHVSENFSENFHLTNFFYFNSRLNVPSSPSPITTPDASRPASEEKPDLYCLIPNMSCQRCAVGCGNLNNTLIVCGE